MKTIYVTVAVRVKDKADAQEVVSEMDYSLVHDDIIGTEIVDFNEAIDS